MTYRLQNMMLAMLLALTTLFVGIGTLSQNPTSGGYQLFERAASGISADIQLASLENFAPLRETASEYAIAPNSLTKPTGVPDTWVSKPTSKGGRTRYSNPDNPHDFVRVMPGNPNSPNPAQQQSYVIRSQNGRIVDVNGNPVASNDPAAHIPLSDFEF